MGFAVPIGRWINTDWKELSDDLLVSQRALQRGNIEPSHVNRLLREHRAGQRDHHTVLWTLMVLEMWYRRYIDPDRSTAA